MSALSLPVWAQQSSVVFSREALTILSAPPSPPADAQEASGTQDAEEDAPTPQPTEPASPIEHRFLVSVEQIQAVPRAGVINPTDIRASSGVLHVLPYPQEVDLTPGELAVRVDLLFVDAYGYIHTIARDITPSALVQPTPIARETKALLYLEGGMAQRLGIHAGDRLMHRLFPERPVVEAAPAADTPAATTSGTETGNTSTP